jgi:hypothetical protein
LCTCHASFGCRHARSPFERASEPEDERIGQLKSGTLKQAVEFVLNLRTILAALRRRKLGENSPPKKGDWGYSQATSTLDVA